MTKEVYDVPWELFAELMEWHTPEESQAAFDRGLVDTKIIDGRRYTTSYTFGWCQRNKSSKRY